MDGIRWTSNSTLQRASTFFDSAQLRRLNTELVELFDGAHGERPLGLERVEDVSVCLIDSTCLKANIRFPADWGLLKDVALTLLKALRLIRQEGLRHRMPYEAEKFIRQMNQLCIEMTHSRRSRAQAPRPSRSAARGHTLQCPAGRAHHRPDRRKARTATKSH